MSALAALMAALLAFPAGAAEVAADDLGGTFFHRGYTGSIGGKYAFTMELRKAGTQLRGSYRYAGKKSVLTLTGKTAADSSFVLTESSAGKVTGEFKGRLESGRISGVWAASKGAKALSFVADQTAETDLRSKAAVLRAAAGTYPLQKAEGSAGISGMNATWREGHGWSSNFSGISRGRREATDAKLKRTDVALLNSMQVSVDAALTVRFSARDAVLLEIPYMATRNEPIDPEIKEIVTEDEIVLLQRRSVDYSAVLAGNFGINPKGYLFVFYKPAEESFVLYIKMTRCCDSSVLTFTRKK